MVLILGHCVDVLPKWLQKEKRGGGLDKQCLWFSLMFVFEQILWDMKKMRETFKMNKRILEVYNFLWLVWFK